VLGRLVERGLVESRGERPGRDYQLTAVFERRSGTPGATGRPPGFDRSQQEALILQYVQDHGQITRREAMQLGGLSQDQASRLLRQLARQNLLRLSGTGRATAYTRPTD
jgi:ATP-dependent DNA helicase RecG